MRHMSRIQHGVRADQFAGLWLPPGTATNAADAGWPVIALCTGACGSWTTGLTSWAVAPPLSPHRALRATISNTACSFTSIYAAVCVRVLDLAQAVQQPVGGGNVRELIGGNNRNLCWGSRSTPARPGPLQSNSGCHVMNDV